MNRLLKISTFAGIIVYLLLFVPACGLLTNQDEPPNPDSSQTTIGDTLWVHHLAMGENELWMNDSPLAIGTDGTIYYGASGGQANWEAERIYAVNKTDGSLKWKTDPLAIWHLNSDIMVGDNGTVYVLSATKLYAIDPSTGAFLWVWEVPHTLPYEGNDVYTYGELGGLALANNGDLIMKTNGSGSYYRAMYCIGEDGTMKWHRFIGAENSPITIGYEGTIYDYEHISDSDVLTATNPATGTLIWSLPIQLIDGSTNVATVSNGDIITLIAPDTLIRMNPTNRHIVWKISVNANHHYIVIGPDGFIYLYDQWAGTYLINIENGTQKGDPVTIPHNPVIDSKGQLVGVISDSNPFLSITDNTGTIKWEYKGDTFYGHSIAISNDNIVYLVNAEKLYAIQGDAKLAQTGWPKHSHDNRNTFNYSKH